MDPQDRENLENNIIDEYFVVAFKRYH